MREKLTIGEMANLRQMTTETLRHYDRVGLFKPNYIDAKTGYRYYSIHQFEVLGTIKELRQLDMSIEEIKNYFEKRNARNSLQILEKKHQELKDKLRELHDIKSGLGEKVAFLKKLTSMKSKDDIEVLYFPERKLLTSQQTVSNAIEWGYAVIELENMLTFERAPHCGNQQAGCSNSTGRFDS
ncbi:hypothetical protein BK126_04805 [Paenibacillus sp. FSL H7-0326]|uniref:MerR family transcriptional regulator n=1 Tax=Paenibacillus sp. FSL H7-0326 TaxID=1921144 RepID=UPI00096D280E|nr:helix-turn-helix domain-containing protein [Paenibacillus sp. FSL H7-0326]OMC71415.1 hypothetical protein BK126_04805 [Paenibacillus sp. FSL H7-0326]